MEFDDIFELLESLRLYRLRAKECLIPTMSVTNTAMGFATADGDYPSVTWTIPTKVAKATALARGTRESARIHELLGSYMGRKQLLEELRAGTLEYGVARHAESTEEPLEPVETVREAPQGPRQVLLPL
jgi:hypothetical protein